MDLVHQAISFLAIQRREYVDPHVMKIWEKVKERSGIDPAIAIPRATASASSIAKEVPKSASSLASKVSVALSSQASQASSSISSISSSISVVATSATKSAASKASEASISLDSVASTASNTASSVIGQASASVSSATATASSGTSSLAQKIKEGAGSIGFIPAGTPASSISSVVSSIVSQAASAATAAAAPTYDGELDDFFADIGMSEDETPLESEAAEETATSPPEPTPETEEQKATRLAKTAELREGIIKRHADWEGKLDAQIAEGEKKFRQEVAKLRADNVEALKSSVEVRAELEGLVSDSEKYLKGAEGYLKTLEKDGKSKEEKVALWDRVLEKIEAKFTKRLSVTETVVNSWYEIQSIQEVKKVRIAVGGLLGIFRSF